MDDDDLNDLFEILSNARRRCVLRVVSETDGGVSLGHLAEVVAADEGDRDIEEISGQPRKRVYISLRQTHLPVLEEAGLIEWDRETNVVIEGSGAGDLLDALDRFIAMIDDRCGNDMSEPVWGRFKKAFGTDA